MDPFLIAKFQDIASAREAEKKLKGLGIQAALSEMQELYVTTRHVDQAVAALGLADEVRSARQPGPWCRQCGQQLVLHKKNSGFFSSSAIRYCYKCNEAIKDVSRADRVKKRVRRALVEMGYHAKPSFLIIGAQKAGTSALFEIMKQHPQLVASRKKEVRFFDDFSELKYGDFVSYHEMFPLPHQLRHGRLTYESSPSYLFNPRCAERIYRYSPEMKLIAILREPGSRAFSAWKMHKRFADSSNPFIRTLADPRSFVDAIKHEIAVLEKTVWEKELIGYIKRGIYAEQLERYLQYFPSGSLLILEHAHLTRDPQAVFNDVFRFLRIDDAFIIKNMRVNVSTDHDEMPEEARDILRSFYKPYNERLFKLLGREYDW